MRSSSSTTWRRCSRRSNPELPRVRRRRLDLPYRALRRDHESQPDPPRAVPHSDAVVHVHPPALDRIPARRGRADLQGHGRRHADGRSDRSGADAHGHRRQRHRRRADPRTRARRAHEGRDGGSGEDRRVHGLIVSWLLPLPTAIPLLGAALIAASEHVAPRRFKNSVALAAAAASLAFSLAIMVRTERGDLLHWFGGWQPRGGIAIGIGFVADPFGAGMAALASGLVLLALAYSWTYMRDSSPHFDILMLVFCAGMTGFALTGDLFNMFVWFELMGVAAYALAGFKVEELGPLQGAINFAVTNTIAAYVILLGIGLLYARTGALNFAQLGHDLARGPLDRLVIVALTLLF